MTRESLLSPLSLPSLSPLSPSWIIQHKQQQEEGVERYIREDS